MWPQESSAPSPNRRNAPLYALVATVLVAGAAVVYLFDPTTTRFYPPCAFNLLTGLLCPGCGGTRALHALLHGDVAAAFAFNPILFVAMGTGAFVTVRPSLLTKTWFAWTAAAVLLGWGVIRNVLAL
jgi:hypothetical protein